MRKINLKKISELVNFQLYILATVRLATQQGSILSEANVSDSKCFA